MVSWDSCELMANKARIHAFVSGRVQGVFYRKNTEEQARSLGLTGWVRNLDDGRVEVLAEGSKDKLERLLEWCHKGPAKARVDSVDHVWEDAKDEFTAFSVKK